jgi:hypothetical protein
MMTLDQYRAEALNALHRAGCATNLSEKRSWEASATSWNRLAAVAEWQDAFAYGVLLEPAAEPPRGSGN